LIGLLCSLLGIYVLVVFARIILEWIQVPGGHPVGVVRSALAAVVDPLLRPIRNLVRPVRIGPGALDFSPLILIAAIWVVQRLLC
jgi:YggT family protein